MANFECKLEIRENEVDKLKEWMKEECEKLIEGKMVEMRRRGEKVEKELENVRLGKKEEKIGKNLIIRKLTDKWNGKEENIDKAREMLHYELGAMVPVEEAEIIAIRGEWTTIKVKLMREEDKDVVYRMRRKAGRNVTMGMKREGSRKRKKEADEGRGRRQSCRRRERGRMKESGGRTRKKKVVRRAKQENF